MGQFEECENGEKGDKTFFKRYKKTKNSFTPLAPSPSQPPSSHRPSTPNHAVVAVGSLALDHSWLSITNDREPAPTTTTGRLRPVQIPKLLWQKKVNVSISGQLHQRLRRVAYRAPAPFPQISHIHPNTSPTATTSLHTPPLPPLPQQRQHPHYNEPPHHELCNTPGPAQLPPRRPAHHLQYPPLHHPQYPHCLHHPHHPHRSLFLRRGHPTSPPEPPSPGRPKPAKKHLELCYGLVFTRLQGIDRGCSSFGSSSAGELRPGVAWRGPSTYLKRYTSAGVCHDEELVLSSPR